MKSILFVCLGNICRSPLAEAIAKKLDSNLKIESCGTGSWHVGEHPCSNSVKIAALHSVDISKHKARQITAEDIKEFDYIIALDDSNLNDLKAMGVINSIKLGSFGFEDKDVPDPYFFDGFEGFELVYDMINVCVKNLLNEVNGQ